jgi:four helix bundle protein
VAATKIVKRESLIVGKKDILDSNGGSQRVLTFEDLDVWKVCRAFRVAVANLVDTLPREEKYRLADQLLRASRSVTANLAEGYGRFHYTENVQFARQARGSLYELIDHLSVACDEKFISSETFQRKREEVLRAVAVVNGFIRYLAKQRRILQLTNNDPIPSCG